MNKKRLIFMAGGAALVVIVVSVALISTPVALAVLGALQVAALLIALDNRRVVSSRVFAAARKLERHLIHALTGKSASERSRSKRRDDVRGGEAGWAEEIALIKASLVFDQEWYETQIAGTLPTLEAAIAHYLERGSRAGFSPHPLFDQRWAPAAKKKQAVNPLVAYLRNDEHLWEKPTSALFDPAFLDEKLAFGEYGPLSAFIRERGSDAPLPCDPDDAMIRPGLTLDEVRPHMLEMSRAWRQREDSVAATRGSGTPPEPSPELADALDSFVASGRPAPLVSVVLPTWNRAKLLRAAIDSIKAQSYENWELIIADDGSIDDTRLVLESEAARDVRIKPVLLPHRGVSAARNAALAHAKGEYIAFLDSDKVWEPDFLRAMIAYLERFGHDAGYSIVEVSKNGNPFYRSVAATRESLLLGNSIDQTALVARRSLIEQTGGFDESLKRAVDYDLILSLNELTELTQVPFVGVRYTEDDQDPNRISEAQSVAWNFYVQDRRMWRYASPPDVEPGLLTVVVDDVETGQDARAVLADLSAYVGRRPTEFILVARSNEWSTVQSLALAELSRFDVRVLSMPGGASRPLRVNDALRAARGEHVYLTTAHHRHVDGTVADLLAAFEESGASAAHPVVLDSKRLVSDAGVIYSTAGTDPVGLLQGLPADWAAWRSPVVPVPGATLPLLLRGSTVRAINGMNTKLYSLWADVDMSQRAAAAVAEPVVVATEVVAQAMRPTAFSHSKQTEADVRMFASSWAKAPDGSATASEAAGVVATFEGFTAISATRDPAVWTRAVWRPAAPAASVTSTADRPARPLQWSIKTAAPADDRADSWGDYHFANSLAAALKTLGQRASVDFEPNAARATANADDVVLNLRGLRQYPLPADATSLIWVISHPEHVSAKELERYDLRYAASALWPQRIADQWGVDVKPLLQCTDPTRFYIDDEPVAEVQGKLLMVGNSRNDYRPAAWHTANAGLPVAIYGTLWEKFVDEKFIAGSYVPNDQLRRYYRSAAWALNDHWADMRDDGFISNRVFDVLAAGGRLLTDRAAGMDELFPRDILPNGVAAFSTPAELLAIAEGDPERFYDESRLAAISEHVRDLHSFEARARVLIDDVMRHRSAVGL